MAWLMRKIILERKRGISLNYNTAQDTAHFSSIETDISNISIGPVLQQPRKCCRKPPTHFSRKLLSTEIHYSIFDRQ